MAFIDLPTAAKRSGKSEAHLRRLAGSKWMGEGLARLEQPPGGGRSTWMIDEEADPSLARVKFAEDMTREFDLRTIGVKDRRKATDRQRIVELWQADVAAGRQLGLSETKITQRFIDKMLIEENRTIGRATLFNWARAARDGIAGLVRVYGQGDKIAPAVADPFFDAVKTLWLRQSRPPLKTCYDYARLQAESEGWAICSFKTIQRRIANIPEQVVIKMRLGPTAFANQVLPPARRDYESIESNGWWCSDHHQFDAVVRDRDGKLCRPWITCWEDLRSRKIVGWHIFAHDPNQSTILISLRAGCLAEGIPDHVLIDNGKDYDCYGLQGFTKKERLKWRRKKIKVLVDLPEVGGVLGALKIKVVHAIAYNAKAKPVERFFNTVCNRFSKFIPTYCGRNPQERPENHLDQLARGNAPTIDDFAATFATWLECDYHTRSHEGDAMDGLSPTDAFDRFLVSRRVARAEELQLLIARTSKPLVADREGVCWDGVRYGKGDPALYPHFRSKVYLRVDPDDITRAAAYTIDDKWIADLAANYEMPFGASEQEFRQAERERKAIRELTNKYLDLGPRRGADTMELMAIRRQEQKALPGPKTDSPSLKPVRTPLEGQLRKAAGAEGMSAPRMPKMFDLTAAADDLDLPSDRPTRSSEWLYESGGES